MTIDTLKEMLKRHEGVRLTPYFCPAGKRTIGVGWNMDAHKLPEDIAACLRVTGKITETMAERLLNISITNATDDCRDIYPGFDSFTEARRFALIDWMFNCGSGTVLNFKKTIKAINEQRWGEAATELLDSEYAKQVPNRAREVSEMLRIG